MLCNCQSAAWYRQRWIGDIPLGCLRNRDAFSFQVFPKTSVQFSETAQFEIRHRLLILLHLVGVFAGGVSGRHLEDIVARGGRDSYINCPSVLEFEGKTKRHELYILEM